MVELEIGQEIVTEYGTKAKVLGVIGKGEIATVYRVEINRTEWALKWFDIDKIPDPEAYRQNISKNIKDGEPNNKFLWPKYLTKKDADGNFGYIMEIKPDSFESFRDLIKDFKLVKDESGDLIKKHVRFSSIYAMVTAAINIVNTFRKLHKTGKRYHYMSDGGFFVNTETGAVLVGECDNIAGDGVSFGIKGYPGYTAPELIMGKAKPSIQTDNYSLAAVLFKLLFRGDPMEGRKVVMDISLTEEEYLKHYGENALFVYHPDDDSNRPVRGIHDNVIKFWQTYPDYINTAFTHSFTQGLTKPHERIGEEDWQKLFIRLRSEMIICMCGRTNFVSQFEKKDSRTYKCPRCGTEFSTLAFSNKNYRVPLYVGCKFYECEIDINSDDFLTVAGEFVENKIRAGVLGIKNCSDKTWKAKMPDGVHDIEPGKGFPLWQGLEIDFGTIKAKV